MDKMQRVSLRRPLNSRKIGDVIDNLGEVVQVYQQGSRDIRVVRIGKFPRKAETMTESVKQEEVPTIQQMVERPVQVAKPNKKKPAPRQKIQIAEEATDKQIIDETQDRSISGSKKLLRG